MKLVVVTLLVFLPSVVTLSDATTRPATVEPERTLILRVRTRGSLKHSAFSGKLEFDTAASPTVLTNEPAPFGIKMRANSLKGFLQKEGGSPDLLVELIEFREEREVSSVTKAGATFELDAHQSADKSVLSIR